MIFEAFKASVPLHTLVSFGTYIVTAFVMITIFCSLYHMVTPHKEIKLIKEGNLAAAIAFSGTVIALAFTVSTAIRVSEYLLDFMVWGTISFSVQVFAYIVTHVILGNLSQKIVSNDIGSAVFLAGVSIALALINAACMTPA